MCIQVVDNINSIKKHINNYYRGIHKGYNREEAKERLISPGISSLRNKIFMIWIKLITIIII